MAGQDALGKRISMGFDLIVPVFGMQGSSFTIVIPVQPGAALPDLPAMGIASIDDYLKLPGARTIAKPNLMPGASPNQLLFYETTTIRNLYRVQLR